MLRLAIAPAQWSELPDIDEVRPLNDSDTDCFASIREVLRNHGRLDRFGVALLHSHFSLDPDEIMVECSDDESRTLLNKPVRKDEANSSTIGTVWAFLHGQTSPETGDQITSQLTIGPVQWTKLRNTDDVQPLNDSDTKCLAAIRDVLIAHGKLGRFGISLLLSHFSLSPDEIMLESSDDEKRTLVTKPVKGEDAECNKIGTIWALRDGDVSTMAWCRQYCRRSEWNIYSHRNAHKKEK